MKKLVLALLVIVAGRAALAQQSEPIKFRGAYIGQSLADYVDCSSGKGKVVKDGYKMHGKLCEGRKGYVFHTQTKGLMEPKTSGEVLIFEEQKLAVIRILVPNEDWDKVRYDLVEKLGPPTSEMPQVFQNGFGARWEFSRGFWSQGTTVVYAEIKVLTLFGAAVEAPFSHRPATQGIEVTVMDAQRAKLPSTAPNSLD
jgi:hypothetical protein